jgi:hypothetical protein
MGARRESERERESEPYSDGESATLRQPRRARARRMNQLYWTYTGPISAQGTVYILTLKRHRR